MRFKYPGKGEFKCLPTYSGLRKEAPKMKYTDNKQIIVKETSFPHLTQSKFRCKVKSKLEKGKKPQSIGHFIYMCQALS